MITRLRRPLYGIDKGLIIHMLSLTSIVDTNSLIVRDSVGAGTAFWDTL